MKGGATFNAIFELHIEGSAEERLCPSCVTGTLRAKACIGASEGWPNNRINIEAWYQKRTASKCKGKVTVSTLIVIIIIMIALHNVIPYSSYRRTYPVALNGAPKRVGTSSPGHGTCQVNR